MLHRKPNITATRGALTAAALLGRGLVAGGLLGCGLVVLAAPVAAQDLDTGAQTPAEGRARTIGETIHTEAVPNAGSVDWGRAEAVIDAPMATVMGIVTDYDNYRTFLPHFRQSRVLSRRGNNAMVYMQAAILRESHTLWAQLRIFARRPQGDTQVIEARMLSGNMEQFVARWEVTPIEDGTRTLVSFQILVDPDLPLPSSLFTTENVKAARDTLRALRRQVRAPQNAVAQAR